MPAKREIRTPPDLQVTSRILERAAARLSLPDYGHAEVIELQKAIRSACAWHNGQPDLTSDRISSERFKALKRVRYDARAILSAIKDEHFSLDSCLSAYFPIAGDLPDFDEMMASLGHLAEAASQEITRLKKSGRSEKAPLQYLGAPTTPDGFFIRRMEMAYETIFKVKAWPENNPDKLATWPFKIFMAEVSEAVGKPMSLEAIRKARGRASNPDNKSQN